MLGVRYKHLLLDHWDTAKQGRSKVTWSETLRFYVNWHVSHISARIACHWRLRSCTRVAIVLVDRDGCAFSVSQLSWLNLLLLVVSTHVLRIVALDTDLLRAE